MGHLEVFSRLTYFDILAYLKSRIIFHILIYIHHPTG